MGFDNECIPNIQSLAGEYFCPVCRLLVYPNEALQSMCTHLYCKPCLTYIAGTSKACPYDGYLVTEADAKPLVESNKVLADTIGKIMVCCLYQKSGCTWQGTLSESASHCPGCAFGNSPVVCNRCGIQIVHCQVQEHAQTCPGMQQALIQQSQGLQPVATAVMAASSNQTQLSNQAVAVVSASQANASEPVSAPTQDPYQKAGVAPQDQAIAAAVPTSEQWYLQQYQQYYQNYSGYYPYQQQTLMASLQQQLQSQSQAPQVAGPYQAPNVQPPVQPELQTQTQIQSQTQSQAQASVLPQSQPVFQATPVSQPQNQMVAGPLPQTYPSALSNSSVPSQTFPPSQGPQYPQTQSLSQPQPILQAYPSQQHMQHTQLPQYQQFPGQVQAQLHLQHPLARSQAITVQTIQPLHPNVQAQKQLLPMRVTVNQSYPQPQPNQQYQVGVSQNNMLLHHQVGTQPTSKSPQIQNIYPQQQPHLRPPLSQTPDLAQQLPITGQLLSICPTQQPALHQLGVSVNQCPVVQPTQQHLSQQPHLQLPMPTHPNMGKSGVVHNHMHPRGPFTNQSFPLHSHLRPQDSLHGLPKYPQNVLPHPPIIPNHGLQPQMNPHIAIALHGRSGQLAPIKPDVNEGDIQRTKVQLHLTANEHGGVASQPTVGKQGDLLADKGKDDRAVGSVSDAAAVKPMNAENNEETKTKVDSEPKGRQIDCCAESEQCSSTVVKPSETKNETLAKPVLEGKDCEEGPLVRFTPLKESDRTEQMIGKMQNDRKLPEMHVSPVISPGGNQQPVNNGLLDSQQRAAAPFVQVPPGVTHHLPAPRYPTSVLRPHGPKLLASTPSCTASIPSFDGGLRPYSLGHHVSEGIYDQGHLRPFYASKVSPSINSLALGLRDEKVKPLLDDRVNPISVGPSGRRLFEEDFKHFTRPSSFGNDTFPRPGSLTLRPLDRGLGTGISSRPREKYGVVFNSGPASRFFQASNDSGEIDLGPPEDGRERLEAARVHPDMHGPVFGFGCRHIDGPRSPKSKYPGMPSHGYVPLDNGIVTVRAGVEDTEGRDRFGFLNHLPRRESEANGNLRIGEPLLSGDGRADDHFGLHGLSGHLRFEEQVGFDGFPHRRPGDPGFRSRYSLQGFPSDGASFPGDVKPFENSGKRKLTTMGWCRICKVDCETMEGLDLHSQTKEHQKKSMDMVVMIKQNAKKYKLASGDYSLLNNPDKLKGVNTEDRHSMKKAIP